MKIDQKVDTFKGFMHPSRIMTYMLATAYIHPIIVARDKEFSTVLSYFGDGHGMSH